MNIDAVALAANDEHSLAPLLRGEGWGEGLFPSANLKAC
jgi:hypothetical protein